MTTVIATLKVQAGHEAAFEQAAQEMIAHVRANEPGTLAYVCHRGTAEPNEYVFYEVYTDDAALAAHSGSAQMMTFFGAVGGLLSGRPVIKMYQEIGGKR